MLLILLLVLIPDFSMADKAKREVKEMMKERREIKKREQREGRIEIKNKFDNRSSEQKRKDRTILCLMALAGFLVFKQMHE